MLRLFFLASVISILISCSSNAASTKCVPETFVVINERDLIPEGTAYDPETEQVFISSMYKRKIIAIRKDGSYYDFVKEAQDSIWATLGMEVDTAAHKLWVISSKGGPGIVTRQKIENDGWASRLYCYDLPSGTLYNIYHVTPSTEGEYCFNDLTISPQGDIYITESLSNRVFILPAGKDSIEVFLTPQGHHFLNGIALVPDQNLMFVSSAEGLISVDLSSKDYTTLPYGFTTQPASIDGLAFYNKSLIGHQSTLVTRFYLTDPLDAFIGHTTVDSLDLDSSTTGEIGKDGWYYYIANSQIRSGIDYKNSVIMPMDSLEPVVIKRIKL